MTEEFKHGRAAYQAGKCRCAEKCRKAVREYMREYRDRPFVRAGRNRTMMRRKQLYRDGILEIPEHGLKGYSRGCLCEKCRAARKEYDANRQKTKTGRKIRGGR